MLSPTVLVFEPVFAVVKQMNRLFKKTLLTFLLLKNQYLGVLPRVLIVVIRSVENCNSQKIKHQTMVIDYTHVRNFCPDDQIF